jgi:hypothetical protein
VIGKAQVGALQPAAPLDVYGVVAIDQYVRYRFVGKQWFERAETHDVVFDLLYDGLALAQVERCLLFCQQAIDGLPDLGACLLFADRFDQRKIEDLQELVVNALFPFHFLVGNRLIGRIQRAFGSGFGRF